jgi:AAA+ ATPase superfamily predicted ATPase
MYFSIMNAIAYGNSKPTDIANFVGIKSREIYPYLELLIQYGFIIRETITGGERKSGIYRIKDNFFDFWFNFVHKHREEIEIGNYKLKSDELETFCGKRFEMFIRENANVLIDGFENSGRWWYKDKEIDLVMVNTGQKKILFGECKWGDGVDGNQLKQKLVEKAKHIDWLFGEREESYVIFAKSFKQKPVDCHAIDLKELENLFLAK